MAISWSRERGQNNEYILIYRTKGWNNKKKKILKIYQTAAGLERFLLFYLLVLTSTKRQRRQGGRITYTHTELRAGSYLDKPCLYHRLEIALPLSFFQVLKTGEKKISGRRQP